MKKLKFFLFVMTALIISIVAMSFTFGGNERSEAGTKTKAATTYFYIKTGTISAGDFANTANWSTTNNDEDCDISGNRPCQLDVPDGSTLSAQISGKSNAEVLALDDSRKP
ncbi:MAG: DUF6520 family protein [Niabella sp.]